MSDTTTAQAESAESPATAGQPSGRRLRLPGRGGGSPLFRNAYALMLNTGISALLGLSFWLAAARYYSEAAVGQGSAAIAAMKLLAGLTALTLTGALARFIPVAGRSTGRLVLRTYAGSSVVVAVAAVIFLATLDLWGPSYRFLHGPLNGLGFVLAVIAWSLLTLQDGVLTGLRSALWVPVGNTVFSAVKLVLLVAIATSIPTAGVFVSWVAAIAMSVIPLGWLVFRRLVPRHVKATEERAQPPTLRQMGRFLAGDYTGSLFSLAVVYAVPVIVAAQVSSEDNAYFYITTTIGGTVNLLAINMGASLTVEGAHDPSTLAQNCRAALRRMARIMLPVAAVLFFGAPYILGVFGEGYANAATPLLRWFAVGALLRVVIEVYFAVLRAQSRTSGLAYLQGGLCVLVLGLTLLLLPRMGLTGAGVAEISSLAVVAAVAGVKLYRVVKSAPPAGAKGADAAAPDGDLADLAVDGDLGDADRGDRGRTEKGPAGGEYGTRWALRSALDPPTMPLGARLDFDHPERRPDVRPGPETPAAGTPVTETGSEETDHRPTWALRSPLPRAISSPRSGSSVPEAAVSADASESGEARPRGKGHSTGEERSAGEEPEAPVAPEAAPPPTPRRAPFRALHLRVPELGVGLLLLAALALYWLPVRGIGEADLDRMGGLGLISVLPTATLLGGGLLALSFASLLWLDRPRTVLLTLALLATVVSLHALPAVLETEPRFPTAWQHLGFMDYIDRTGSAVPDLDARWSWPGFFAAATFVAEACGVSDMSSVIRWWPLAMQLLYLPPLFLLMRSMRASWRAKWAGVWIFVLSGWVGQDYFSPQGFTYGMYLAFVAVLLVWFREPRVLWTKRRPGEAEVTPAGRREKAVLLLVLVGLFAGTVPAHQLTPFVMLGVLAVLVMAGRSTLRGLPMLFAVLVAVWIGFFAEPYWSGHFDELFGGVGGVGGNVTSSVSGRIEGGSSTHKLVLYVRVAMAGGVMAFACWGWWRRRFAGYSERSLLVLAFVPFLGFGMQSYGGEMALRVFMFALPGAALLAGLALFPRTGATAAERDADRKSLAPLAALMTGLLLIGGFLVARWGNEPFERVRGGEVAAMEFVYAHDDPSVRLLWMSNDTLDNVTPAIPWGARDMEKVNYVPTLAPVDPVLVASLVKSLKDAGPNSYLMINRSQSVYLRLDAGYSATWEKRLTANLDKRPELKKVLSNEDVSLYALREQPDGAVEKPDPGPVGPKITWTPWSVVGALAALALIVLLAAREVVRVAVAPGVRQLQWLQSTFWFSLPLLAVLLASLVQRFLTMS
ncbi:polysaccharide biosynthesis C-terminal domain-containing protein [Streptomyces sp. ISL-98]|uniref:lipopolysaccharide biosynthesis protein n=1 Tax=Streptomyces sp. ISL-98 TaxID=2819192 RepID=UPI001BEB5F24|nr:polysaccharide biosynthesis C-terminal domain-containing protein [Streptomyces sp. ISL-98]MBT2508256.1 polysaccharide biosynthesis C-terminal domain-containing protein [Streptomyces sp. ISL-98]